MGLGNPYEGIFVNDGSRDATLREALAVAAELARDSETAKGSVW
jgi:hypothetical protein